MTSSSPTREARPQPVRALQREDQFSALARGRWRWASTRWPPATGARLGGRLRRAVDRDKDQSLCARRVDRGTVAPRGVPLVGDTPPSRRSARRRPARVVGGRQGRQPRHLLHPPVTPGPSWGADRRAARRGGRRRGHGPRRTRRVHGFTIGQRKGWASRVRDPTACPATSPRSTPNPAPCGWAVPRTSTCGR